MSAKQKIWLVAQAPDGTGLILPAKTAAGYSWASITLTPAGWQLTGIHGFSSDSVRRRTRTAFGSYDFEVVHIRPLDLCVPDIISSYFIGSGTGLVIRQQFSPSGGWTSPHEWKRPSVAYLRQLQADGITAIGVGYGGNASRIADFRLDEILRPGRPLFGGSLIGSRVR